MCMENKPRVMDERRKYMDQRYDFTGAVTTEVTMTRGKPVPVGPVARLPKGVANWCELASLDPEEIRRRDLFPLGFRPLSHPLHTVGHQLFPAMWLKFHPEHERFDVDFDIPELYLPEFPPPLFLTTRPDLGDVSQGHEITQANFRELFEGILTPEQLEGLRLLVTKFPTTWFNQTKHRVTEQPVRGTACFDCHVNGHTNGAIALDPATRPTLARTRVDTPSLARQPQHATVQLSALDPLDRPFRRGGGVFRRRYQPSAPARRPPARQAEHEPDGRLQLDRWLAAGTEAGSVRPADRGQGDPGRAAGEALFFGKARCAECHPAPTYTDDKMHDLRVEEFYNGRAQGWIKTFSLRGIKDSPPYLHDGRLLTLEDSVEFFNLVFGLKLGSEEKSDLVAFMRQL